MKKKNFVILIALLLAVVCLGLAACENGNNGKNSELEEYSKIVTTVATDCMEEIGEKKSNTVKTAAKTVSAGSLQKTSVSANILDDIFDTLDSNGENAPLENIQPIFSQLFAQAAFIPAIGGDAVYEKFKTTKFYGTTLLITDYTQYVSTDLDGTHRVSSCYAPSNAGGGFGASFSKDVYLIVDFDYRNETDYNFTILQFTNDYKSVVFAYGNSNKEWIYLCRNAEDVDLNFGSGGTGEVYGEATYYKNGTAKTCWDVEVVNECLTFVENEYKSIDQAAVKAKFKDVQYTVTAEEFEKHTSKYFQCLAGPQEAEGGFIVQNGVVMHYEKGTNEVPTELTLPTNATAVFCGLYLPEGVMKLNIPANIVAVKGRYSAFDEAFKEWQENGEQGPKPQPEDYPESGELIDRPAKELDIRLETQDGTPKLLETIEAPNSPLFDVRGGCLYDKEGTLIYATESVTSLTLEAGKLSPFFERGGLGTYYFPNLKNLDVTTRYTITPDTESPEENAYWIGVDNPLEFFFDTQSTAKHYRLDTLTIRGIQSNFELKLYEAVESVGAIKLYGETNEYGFDSDVRINAGLDNKFCAINAINTENIQRLSLDCWSENGLSSLPKTEITVDEAIENVSIGAYGETILARLNLPWSQVQFETLGKQTILNNNFENPEEYEALGWGYDTNEHDYPRGGMTVVYKAPTQEEQADAENLQNFKNYYIHKGADSDYGYDCIVIDGYFGTETIIHVPETMLGYPVAGFTLSNSDSSGRFGRPTVAGVTELHLPNTLEAFSVWNPEYESEQYHLDKIVYDGTKERFEAVSSNNIYYLLTMADRIDFNDGSFAQQPAAETWRFADASGNTITVDVRWSETSAAFDTIRARIVFGGETFERHRIEWSSSFSFWCGGELVGKEGEQVIKNQLYVEISGQTESYGHKELSIRFSDGNNNDVEFSPVSAEEFSGTIDHEYTRETVIAPTCAGNGYTEHWCAYCDTRGSVDNEIPALGHVWGEWKETAATCHTYAYRQHTCPRCEQTETDYYGSELAEHTYTITIDEKLPTCTEIGWRILKCETCETSETKVWLDETGQHTYGEDDFCTVCRAAHRIFSLGDNGDSYTIYGLNDNVTESEITVPAAINGKPVRNFRLCDATVLTDVTIADGVTAIETEAFFGCTGLKSVTIPNTVISIGSNAFMGCSSLTAAIIPDSVTSIGYGIFNGCTALSSITLPFVGSAPDFADYPHFGYIFHEDLGYHNNNSVPVSLKSVTVTSAASIGNSAFSGCSGLISITIPNSVISIGAGVFSGCSGLISIKIPDGVSVIEESTFSNCSTLTSIIIPKNVTSIGISAFRGCGGLTSITFEENSQLTTIGDSAFKDCVSLTAVYLNSIENWCEIAFGIDYSNPLRIAETLYLDGKPVSNLVIPDTIIRISKNAFYQFAGLTSVTIGNGVKTIEDSAFYGCSNLTNVYFGTDNKLAEIGDYAFNNCSALTEFNIQGDLNFIGNSAFLNCTSLTELNIQGNVNSVGDSAFWNCSALAEFNIHGSVNSIGYRPFDGCDSILRATIPGNVLSAITRTAMKTVTVTQGVINYQSFKDSTSLTSVTIGEGVTKIDSYAFYQCTALTDVTFEENSLIAVIGENAFYGCTAIKNLALPAGITNINKYAFSACSALTSVTFGANSALTAIGDSAFEGCAALMSIAIPDSVTIIKSSAFGDCVALAEVTFGTDSTLAEIDYNAFSGCAVLTSIAIPDSVTKLGLFEDCVALAEVMFGANSLLTDMDGFVGCSSLTSIAIPAGVTEIGTFNECVKLSEVIFGANSALTYMGGFVGCSSLTSITIPAGVTEIGNGGPYGAFYGCSSLSAVYIDDLSAWCRIRFGTDGLRRGSNPLNYAHRLYIGGEEATDLIIPNDVTAISAYAFSGYGGKSVTFGLFSTLTSIGEGAFSGCASLTEISVPDSVTEIGESAFKDCITLETLSVPFIGTRRDGGGLNNFGSIFHATDDGRNYLPYSLRTVTVTQQKTIPDNAFSSCELLTNIYLPDGLKEIGAKAFLGCSNLTAIGNIFYPAQSAIGRSISRIGANAFYECSSLITVIENVKYVGGWAVGYSGEPQSLHVFRGDGVADNAFENCGMTEIVIDYAYKIGFGAFLNCGKLETVTLIDLPRDKHFGYLFGAPTYRDNAKFVPATLKNVILTESRKIVEYAFNGLQNIESVSLPASLKAIGQYAFSDCTGLKSLYISSVEAWCEIDFGIEANNPNGKELSNPMRYADNLFIGGEKLTGHLKIPDTVGEIKPYAFVGYAGSTSIELPKSVKTIGAYAFAYMQPGRGERIYYWGSEEDWSKIAIGDFAVNSTYTTIYYYRQSAPTAPGNYWYYDAGPAEWPQVARFNAVQQ